MKLTTVLLFIVLSTSIIFGQKVEISGTISGGNYSSISLKNVMTSDDVQTAEVKNNKFKFKFDFNKEQILALYLDKNNYMIIDLKPGEKVKINYDLDDMNKTTVSGSKGTELYREFVNGITTIVDDDAKFAFVDSLVNANLDQFVSVLFAFNLDYDLYADTHRKLIASLENDFIDDDLFKNYKSEFEATTLTAIGSIPPDINLQDKDGKEVSLYSLRGQYVLLDFWASWCRPCRGESPNLVAAYDKYHDKGFTIYSVSLDQTKDAWVQAIKSDGLSAWTHVSDLKGWQCAAGQAYGISSIPSNFLLGPDGKIVAKNLRGSALVDKLSDILDK